MVHVLVRILLLRTWTATDSLGAAKLQEINVDITAPVIAAHTSTINCPATPVFAV
jgi:hypothetical protein